MISTLTIRKLVLISDINIPTKATDQFDNSDKKSNEVSFEENIEVSKVVYFAISNQEKNCQGEK